jgi:hypothetical protein
MMTAVVQISMMSYSWDFLAISFPSLRDLLAPLLPSEPITDPVAIFLIIMAIMLVAPLLFERLRL